jgi:hypothetical protein
MSEMRRHAASVLAVAAVAGACIAVVPSASAETVRAASGGQRLAARDGWGRAQEVPGTAALNSGGNAELSSVSCASAGNCSAGGTYGIRPPGGRLAPGSVRGNCSAGGTYHDGQNGQQVFVVSEVRGRWRRAEEVPGSAALNKGDFATILSVSCALAGHCVAGGSYDDNLAGLQAFVVSSR